MNKLKQIKKFESGVVSYSLFIELVDKDTEFREKLRFILRNSDLETDWGLNIIHDIVDNSEKEVDAIYDKAKIEKQAVGGNDVATVKTETIFDNDRFWEYVAQLKIDKHDPADVLESWLKEHKPDYFEDS